MSLSEAPYAAPNSCGLSQWWNWADFGLCKFVMNCSICARRSGPGLRISCRWFIRVVPASGVVALAWPTKPKWLFGIVNNWLLLTGWVTCVTAVFVPMEAGCANSAAGAAASAAAMDTLRMRCLCFMTKLLCKSIKKLTANQPDLLCEQHSLHSGPIARISRFPDESHRHSRLAMAPCRSHTANPCVGTQGHVPWVFPDRSGAGQKLQSGVASLERYDGIRNDFLDRTHAHGEQINYSRSIGCKHFRNQESASQKFRKILRSLGSANFTGAGTKNPWRCRASPGASSLVACIGFYLAASGVGAAGA